MLKSNMNHDSTRRTPKVNPFAGMIYCGSCGGAFSLSHTVKQKNKRYSYYICLEDTKRNFSTCPIKRVPSDALEKLVGELKIMLTCSVFEQNAGVLSSMIYKERFF